MFLVCSPYIVKAFKLPASLVGTRRQLSLRCHTLPEYNPLAPPESLWTSKREAESLPVPQIPQEDEGPSDHGVDLFARTWESLDFGVVLQSLQGQCKTGMGMKLAVIPDFKQDVEDVRELYRCVEEVASLPEAIPLGSGMDITAALDVASRGMTLEVSELKEVSASLTSLLDLVNFFTRDTDTSEQDRPPTPCLCKLIEPIVLDDELVDLLKDAFDINGQLCGRKFPEIGNLRRRIESLYNSIRLSVQKLLSAPEFSGMIADEGRGAQVSEVNGRFVLPVRPTYKRKVGIVHDVSRTGKTMYVEPAAVVESTNELTELKLALKAEESRILSLMTFKVNKNSPDILRSLHAAAQIDLASARFRLGTLVQGTVPHVGEEGIIDLKYARHPVLSLRGKSPVPNDMLLDANSQALVLTGPNAGGKTVILKTLGLVALMVRSGIPVPAQSGARVDLFDPVLADIGDLQSVTGDLSTFSGHLMVCKAVLERARPGALVLMDEMGSGTDPAQGVALAQALLEALLDSGARVALTTHYLQLKELAQRDDRFTVAAMEFVDGRPTYRLRSGAVGESYALAVAERLQLPMPVLSRARELMDAGVRQVSDLIRDLEDERSQVAIKAQELESLKREIELTKSRLEKEKLVVAEQKASARRDAAAEYAKDVEKREEKLKEIFEKVRKDPSVQVLGSSLGDLRAVKYQTIEETKVDVQSPAVVGLTPLTIQDVQKLKGGTRVTVLAKDMLTHGKVGTFLRVTKKNEVEVTIGVFNMKYMPEELALAPKAEKKVTTRPTPGSYSEGPKINKKLRKQGLLQNGAGSTEDDSGQSKSSSGMSSPLRVEGNTLDLRGKNLEESRLLCIQFFDRCLSNGYPGCYVLHGHGTEVLKKGLRQWLPRAPGVRKARPADRQDGGDAFTLVEFK